MTIWLWLGQARPEVVLVERGRDWFDYFFGLGGFLTGVAAVGIALLSVFQARGASYAASRTAGAAEKTAAASAVTAEAAREELEMLKAEAAKMPAFELRPELFPYPDDPLTQVLQLGMRNVGQRDAANTVINVLAPYGSVVQHCNDPHGNGAYTTPLLTTEEPEQPGGPLRKWVYLIDRMNLDRGISTVAFFRIRFPSPGQNVVRVKLAHPDAGIAGDIVAEVHSPQT